jgi:hypothetical protein
MGDRITYVFKDGSDTALALYSHWGASTWEQDVAQALLHAQPRWSDGSYANRMAISYLLTAHDEILAETGFGIYGIPVNEEPSEMFSATCVIDWQKRTVTHEGNEESFDSLTTRTAIFVR